MSLWVVLLVLYKGLLMVSENLSSLNHTIDFLLVLWFISLLGNSSCDYTSIEWFSLYRFKCLYRLYLLYIGLISYIYSFGTNSIFIFCSIFLHCYMHNGHCLFGICTKGKTKNKKISLRRKSMLCCRSSKFIEIHIREKNNQEWTIDCMTVILDLIY